MTSFLKKEGLFVFLSTLYPFAFFMSVNSFKFSFLEFFKGIVIVELIISIAYFVMLFLIRKKHFHVKTNISIAYSFLANAWIVRSFTVFGCPGLLKFILFYISICVLSLFLSKKIKYLNIILIVVNIFAFGEYINNIRLEKSSYNELMSKIDKDSASNISFKTHPNVYYFYLESYQGKRGLTNIFHFDNSEFYKFLKNNGFDNYEDMCSNYNYTFASLSSTFLMDHHFLKMDFGNSDTFSKFKNLLAGSNDNLVVNCFRTNGYELNYFMDTALFDKTINVERSNLPKSNVGILDMLLDNKEHIIKLNTLEAFLDEVFQTKKPQFTFIKFGGGFISSVRHAMPTAGNPELLPSYIREKFPDYKDYEKRRYKFLKKYYIDYVEELKNGNEILKKLLQKIVKNDPEAIIILLGDHGTNSIVEMSSSNVDVAIKDGISKKIIFDSFFDVMCSIRIPNLHKIDKKPVSSVNIFRYIFSILSNKAIPFKEDLSMTPFRIHMKSGDDIQYIDIKDYLKKEGR